MHNSSSSINNNSAPTGNAGKWSSLMRLIRFTLPYKWTIALLILLGLINVGFGVLRPLPVKFIIDNVLLSHPLPQSLQNLFIDFGGVPGRMELLTVLIITSVVIVIGASTLSYVSSQYTIKVCQRLVNDLSMQVFDKVQRLSLGYYSKTRIGQLMQRLNGDTYAIYSLIGGIIMPTLMSVTSLLAMFYIMAKINLQLALISISAVPAFAILLIIFRKRIIDSAKVQYETSGKLWSFVQQSLTSMKIIQAYAKEPFTNEMFKVHVSDSQEATYHSNRISTIYNTLGGVLTGVATAIVVGVAATKNIGGTITIGELFIFIGYIGALFGPVNSIASTIQTAITITVRGERVFEVLDSKEIVPEKPNAIVPGPIKGNVEFRNVSFGYGKKEEAKEILHDFNFSIPAGKTVAIVGPTGAGKTSLISLMLRFYDPWQGEIYLDAYKIRDLKLESLRNNISLVLQDALIFPVSLKENIAFGDRKATMEEIMHAAKMAQAHDFIMNLPEGYNTIASEGGVSLSGGEKQRISLARAFLRKAPVLILDEPTSAMDVQTESAIFKALSDYATGKTVFVISHRLSAIRHADIIIAIKNGRIEQKGNHEALMQTENIYSELYNTK